LISNSNHKAAVAIAKPAPYTIEQSNGSFKEVSQGVFNEHLAMGLLIKQRKKLATVREGYYCFEDYETGQLRFALIAVSADESRGTSWRDETKFIPPFAAQIDVDYLIREQGMGRSEAGEYLARTENLHRVSTAFGRQTLGLRS
jgi:hypothetical protein